uniref:Ig-like domain-containing protein n=1 Tax=Oryzias latipes TaxID=8090 RepID=A0A3P9MEG4_ORYLA
MYATDKVIVAGDFNVVPDENQDRYPTQHNSPHFNKIISEFSNSLDLIDIWRTQNPNKLQYTWNNSQHSQRSRIDYWLVTCNLTSSTLNSVQVGDVVVMVGSSAILPCHIITNDRLSQITWQKTVKGKAPNDVFLTIQPKIGLVYSNGKDSRFEFNGNFSDKNGTLKFSNVTLEDEGSYTCIFSLFPGGTQSRNSQLVILVPPITNLMDYTPLEGNEEVPLATCTAAASKPKAEVRWIKGSLEGKVREKLNETQHANGTTTTWSTLLGKPGRQLNGQSVKCVISSEATKEEILRGDIKISTYKRNWETDV